MTVSVVIITKNEAATIGRCVAAAKRITDDVIVMDNGSTDETTDIALNYGCRVYQEKWYGYGTNKNHGAALARHNWILSLDADEIPDDELITAIQNLQPEADNIIYDIRFRAYFGGKRVRFGTWGRDHRIRLFNRNYTSWSEPLVHENLIKPGDAVIKKLSGLVHHYSGKNPEQYRAKAMHYARLNARNYSHEGKKTTAVKLYLAPLFHFLKDYIFLLGILDGKRGWLIANAMAQYTRAKYQYLKQETEQKEKNYYAGENLLVEYQNHSH
ncbi:glycosyltransferase family 2 protein [Mucilaginibacter sp. X5P1]|uniref:glycosyltransferase family 2 protein n=1 Tax=Mucilaginibacter sp. X5P1 TaxID=2723088 RepID=UPI001608B951|nr:glycosyltransferase family 2 protein [Mucilaginibacter sp. X5P1]MBB6138778.1 glycosyltransferase involved in cell wall biosynthesis [Mucilaginibacter sp. X5P1]